MFNIDQYLRKDKTLPELFALAKQSYENLAVSGPDGLPLGSWGVTIATIPMTIQDCNLFESCSQESCENRTDSDSYMDWKTGEKFCDECYKKLEEEQKASVKRFNDRCRHCNCCGECGFEWKEKWISDDSDGEKEGEEKEEKKEEEKVEKKEEEEKRRDREKKEEEKNDGEEKKGEGGRRLHSKLYQ